MKLDYYLNQAIEEYNNESDEESEDSIKDDVQNKEKKIIEEKIKEKNKGVSMKNLLFVKKEKEVKKGKRRSSQFVEEFQLDIIKLRTKFSRDEEKNKYL
jgi:hypothetical protein